MSIKNGLITNKHGISYITEYINGVDNLVRYQIEGRKTFFALECSIEKYQEMTGYEFIFEDDLYRDVLGIEDEYLIDAMAFETEIQVCAGDWVKVCEGWWTFEPDPEWEK